jgi:hypothetical protein
MNPEAAFQSSSSKLHSNEDKVGWTIFGRSEYAGSYYMLRRNVLHTTAWYATPYCAFISARLLWAEREYNRLSNMLHRD